MFWVDFQTMDEALVLVEEHNDDADNENDNIWVHKFVGNAPNVKKSVNVYCRR